MLSCYFAKAMNQPPIKVKFENRQSPGSDVDLVRLEEIWERDDLEHPPEILHTLRFYMLVVITEGSGAHTIDFTDYPCERGTILTIRKDQLHRFIRGGNLKGAMLLFTDEFLVSYLEKPEAQKTLQLFNELLGAPKIQLDSSELPEIFALLDRIKTEYFERHDEYSQGIIRSELHILISKLYRIKASKKQVVANRKYLSEFIELQELVEQQATTTNRVVDYARMLGRSTKTLNTITQTIVFKTAKAFIDEILVKQIKRQLINTDEPVKEIADRTGFEEPTNFYKYFKRHTELTPEQFRRLHS